VLPPEVANLIAAGEVVERPASVVKELCENALDAGATRITVAVRDHGLGLISVTDNGTGMAPADVPVAILPHATSKIRQAEDLLHITTLGFRGEALASIAAVSRLSIITRPPEAGVGYFLECEGGRIVAQGGRACAPGTVVSVSDLFYNTPARRKFLYSPGVETARIVQAVAQLALAHPAVAFRLEQDGRSVLVTPGLGDVRGTAAAVWGTELGRAFLTVSFAAPGISVSGLVAPPAQARADRSRQVLIVNGRPVYSRPLMAAIESAFGSLVPEGRYPAAVIFVDLDPHAVDVNVHPTKREVRFREERQVRWAVGEAVRQALAAANLVPRVASPGSDPARTQVQNGRVPPLWPAAWHEAAASSEAAWGDAQAWHGAAAARFEPAGSGAGAVPEEPAEDSPERLSVPGALPSLMPLGQLEKTYIVAAGEDGLYIIDQHAAHERVVFDRLEKATVVAAQPLAQAALVDVGADGVALFREHAAALAACGFDAEPFDETSILVRGLPADLAGAGPEIARDVLAELGADPARPTVADDPASQRRRARRALAACHGVARAHDTLSLQEMRALIEQLRRTTHPYTCPHGRPTVIRLGIAELERRFGRRA